MSKRNISVLLLALSLFLTVAGCKKKAPPPPPPPPPPPRVEAPPPPPPKAPSVSFFAEPSTIERGQSATLRWNVGDASNVSIEPGIGTVAASGSRQVYPSDTTTYSLTAKGPGGPGTGSATVTVTVPPPPPPPPPQRSLSDVLASDVQDALFDFDKSDIREDARASLTRDADALKRVFQEFPNASLVIEGHCDERGSAEYNLGLGDRRASAAKEFLVQLGVPADRLTTKTLGKERPQCTESTEECWQKNRRAHFATQ